MWGGFFESIVWIEVCGECLNEKGKVIVGKFGCKSGTMPSTRNYL